jgi:hypothetical protein
MDDNLCRYLGFDTSIGVKGISIRDLADTIHPEDRLDFCNSIEASARSGTTFSHDFRSLTMEAPQVQLRAIGKSFQASGQVPSICTGLVYRMVPLQRDAEADLVEHCLAAYGSAKSSNSFIVQYLISMALIEIGYEGAEIDPGRYQ